MTIVEISNKDNFEELFDADKGEHVSGKVFVDIGGYDGDTVTKALAIDSGLKILVIEPISDLCKIMEWKFSSNPNVTIINKAVYDRKGSTQIMEYEGWARGLSTLQYIMTKLRPEGMFTNRILQYTVQIDTIDNILKENDIPTVDYIKIDTEGSEEPVLRGFTKYHKGTRFHVESHIINLENIICKLLEMGVDIEKITVARDGNIKEHVVGSVIGEFTKNGSGIIK
jgi:FkbM family methyltransferase